MISRTAPRCVVALFLVGSGISHFRAPDAHAAMAPWLSNPGGLGAFAGALEVLGGLGILLPGTRRVAGWGLAALLAILAANVHVALLGRMPGSGFPTLPLWLRLPLQAALIACVYWVAIATDRGIRI